MKLTLPQIVDEEEFVFVDTGVLTYPDRYFSRYLFSVTCPVDLDMERIKRFTDYVSDSVELLSHENVNTLSCVTSELRRFENFLEDKERFLGEGQLTDLQAEVSLLVGRAKSSEYQASMDFLDAVKLIADFRGIKKAKRDTIERVVASVYGEFSRASVAAISTRYFHFFLKCTPVLGSRGLLPINSEFRDAFIRRPVRLYAMAKDGLGFDLKEFSPGMHRYDSCLLDEVRRVYKSP